MELDDNTNDYDVICDVKKSQNQQKKTTIIQRNFKKLYVLFITMNEFNASRPT